MKKPIAITNGDADVIRHRLNEQDILIFDMSVETGLRISDILHLKAHNIDKVMRFKEAKTKKYKTVEISDGLFSRLSWLIHRDSAVYAFHSPRTLYKPLHRSTYHKRIKRATEALCVDFSAHSARKLYARNIFNESGDIFAVQKALNHKYITDTCTYLDIDLKALINQQAKGEGS
jgi:integrase